jgi:hypothetical protein
LELKKDLPNFYGPSTTFDDMVTRAALDEAALQSTASRHQEFHTEKSSYNVLASVASSEQSNTSQFNKSSKTKKKSAKKSFTKKKLSCQICKE